MRHRGLEEPDNAEDPRERNQLRRRPGGFLQSERTRAWAYRVILAAGSLALVYGLASDEEVVAWTGFAAALLGNGVAAGHTSTRRRG